MAMTPQTFLFGAVPVEGLTVGELRKICLAKGDHPLAITKAREVMNFSENQVVYLNRCDLDILRHGVQPVTEQPLLNAEGTPLSPEEDEAEVEASDD
jgi:hypothetical protein